VTAPEKITRTPMGLSEAETLARAGSSGRVAEALLRDNDFLFVRLDYLLKQYDRLVQAHTLVVMDTPEDRELHGRLVAEFRKAAGPVRKLIAERDGGVQS
jgi:hypothetical protein